MRSLLVAVGLAASLMIQPAAWGGDHVELTMTNDGARLEFDCAHGDVNQPIRPDTKGAFSVRGTFTPERSGPGPSRDEGPKPLKATYSGTIEQDAMSLQVVVEGQDTPQTYTLTRGQRGNLRKCR